MEGTGKKYGGEV